MSISLLRSYKTPQRACLLSPGQPSDLCQDRRQAVCLGSEVLISLHPATTVACVFSVVLCKHLGSGQEFVQEHKVENLSVSKTCRGYHCTRDTPFSVVMVRIAYDYKHQRPKHLCMKLKVYVSSSEEQLRNSAGLAKNGVQIMSFSLNPPIWTGS